MTACMIRLTAVCSLFLPAMAAAQQLGRDASTKAAVAPEQVSAMRMNEDIEILRRILERTLSGQTAVGMPGLGMSMSAAGADFFIMGERGLSKSSEVRMRDSKSGEELFTLRGASAPHGVPPIQGLEGTYLKGYGVVFSATLPMHYLESREVFALPPDKSLSEWERTRRELHGEKLVQADPKPSPPQTSLADVLLRVLAENGRYLEGLGDEGRLTVALSLRPMQDCMKCHDAAAGAADGMVGIGSLGKGGATGSSAPGGAPVLAASRLFADDHPKAGDETKPAADALRLQASNFAQLSEVRLRQGRIADAKEALEKAVAICEQYRQVAKDGAASEIHLKVALQLARLQLMQGQRDAAVETLRRVTPTVGDAAIGALSRFPKESGGQLELPTKLIISATGRQLKEVGIGKMSLDEFRKTVTIDLWGFRGKPPAERKGQ